MAHCGWRAIARPTPRPRRQGAKPCRDHGRRATSPVLEDQVIGANDGFRMGEPLRRLRPLLPGQARGRRRHEPHLFHRRRLPLLDGDTCRCTDYPNRTKKVPDCVRLTPRNVRRIVWLPPTCGYRLVADGRDLYWWHPLGLRRPRRRSTPPASRCAGKVGADEDDVRDEELEDRIVQWPVRMPKKARKPPTGS